MNLAMLKSFLIDLWEEFSELAIRAGELERYGYAEKSKNAEQAARLVLNKITDVTNKIREIEKRVLVH